MAQDTFSEFLGLGFGVFLRVLSCRFPPLSAGAGLGTLAALLWPRTCFLSFGLGLECFLRFFRRADTPRSVPGHGLGNRAAKLRYKTVCVLEFVFFFVLPTPPCGAGGVLGNFAPPTVAQDSVIFFSFSVVESRLAPPFQRIRRWFPLTFFLRYG